MSIDHRVDNSVQLAATLSKALELYNVSAYGIIGDGVTNDTIALQSLIDKIKNAHTLLEYFHKEDTTARNTLMGTIYFEPGSRVLIDSIIIPPGITLEGNDCTFVANSATTMFYFDASLTGYSGQGGGMRNCVLQGQLLAIRGIHNNRCCWQAYDNVTVSHIAGPAWTLWEVQYSLYSNCRGYASQIAWYVTSNPAANTQCTIDVSFVQCVGKTCMYGFWGQNCGKINIVGGDFSFNSYINILIGRQLKQFIAGYTIVSGGAGYPVSSMIQMDITDSTGTNAHGYVTTNASGVVIGAWLGECGENYTNPTISIPGGSTPASITAVIEDHSTLGDWDGASYTTRAGVTFSNIKCENIESEYPKSGYAVGWVNGTGHKFVKFEGLSITAPSLDFYPSKYIKWLRTDSLQTYIEGMSVQLDNMYVENPGISGDYSLFRSTIGGGLKLFITGATRELTLDKIFKLIVNAAGAAVIGNEGSIFSLDHNEGILASKANFIGEATSTSQLNLIKVGETYNRTELYMGKVSFGDGTAAPDVTLQRTQANLLETPDQFLASDGIRLKTVTAAPVDGDFTIVGSGLMALDTTNSRLYIRVGSTWKSILLL